MIDKNMKIPTETQLLAFLDPISLPSGRRRQDAVPSGPGASAGATSNRILFK